MEELIVLFVLGIFLIIMGAINMTGNLSTLHSYHRKRVTEADRKPFGRMVGLGTMLSGLGVIICGAFQFAFIQTGKTYLTTVGAALMIVCIVVGLTLSFWAMIKYNKGIF